MFRSKEREQIKLHFQYKQKALNELAAYLLPTMAWRLMISFSSSAVNRPRRMSGLR
jgi:hypothetical protein